MGRIITTVFQHINTADIEKKHQKSLLTPDSEYVNTLAQAIGIMDLDKKTTFIGVSYLAGSNIRLMMKSKISYNLKILYDRFIKIRENPHR